MNKKEYGEIEIKKDCFAYKKTRGLEQCKALKCLYCEFEKCSFYKKQEEYNKEMAVFGGLK